MMDHPWKARDYIETCVYADDFDGVHLLVQHRKQNGHLENASRGRTLLGKLKI